MRPFSLIDHCISLFDTALQTAFPRQERVAKRSNPSHAMEESLLTPEERRLSAGLMRVNHAGEVAAQALYQGQALTARQPHIREHLQQASSEETDHLAWCEQRLHELRAAPSMLNPVWYVSYFVIGAVAGLAGDGISLGFLAETEEQVTRHLQRHLRILPELDHKSRAIVKQMAMDENNHALAAYAHGAVSLPSLVRGLMHWSSKLLTETSYHL